MFYKELMGQPIPGGCATKKTRKLYVFDTFFWFPENIRTSFGANFWFSEPWPSEPHPCEPPFLSPGFLSPGLAGWSGNFENECKNSGFCVFPIHKVPKTMCFIRFLAKDNGWRFCARLGAQKKRDNSMFFT